MPATIPIPSELILPTLIDLVQIPSVNPGLSAGLGEAEAAVYCAACLREAGLDVEVQEVAPGRTNILGILRGTGGGPSLMLLGHLDTEAAGEMAQPFQVRQEDGRLHGRGAADMKAGLATMLWAGMIFAETGLRLKGDLIVACTADQKVGGLGTRALLATHRPSAAVLCECTALGVGWCHPGFSWVELETRRSRGSNPIVQASRIVAGLDAYDRELAGRPRPEMLPPPSVRPITMQAGGEWSGHPRACRMRVERRFLPGESESELDREIARLMQALASGDPTFRARLLPPPAAVRPAFHHPPGSAFSQALEDAVVRATGEPARRAGLAVWTDAALLTGAGIPTLVFGPEGLAADDDEWVSEASLGLTAEVLVELAIGWCGLAD
ncbi:MAG: M20/M25/M40 family metallo-hydrolase [Candidatus Eremiobacterota bacterium]